MLIKIQVLCWIKSCLKHTLHIKTLNIFSFCGNHTLNLLLDRVYCSWNNKYLMLVSVCRLRRCHRPCQTWVLTPRARPPVPRRRPGILTRTTSLLTPASRCALWPRALFTYMPACTCGSNWGSGPNGSA